MADQQPFIEKSIAQLADELAAQKAALPFVEKSIAQLAEEMARERGIGASTQDRLLRWMSEGGAHPGGAAGEAAAALTEALHDALAPVASHLEAAATVLSGRKDTVVDQAPLATPSPPPATASLPPPAMFDAGSAAAPKAGPTPAGPAGLAALAQGLPGLGAFVAGLARALSGIDQMRGGFARVSEGLSRLASSLTQGDLGKAAGGALRVAGGVAQATGGFALAAFAAPMAAFAVAGLAVKHFVEALNPSSVMVFEQALYDLTAVIGTALEPVLQTMTGVIRDLGATLLPVMEKLRPVMAQLAQSFGQMTEVFVNALGGILTTLMPVFKFLADVVSAVVPIFQLVYAALAGFVEVLAGLFRSLLGDTDMKSVTDSLKDAFRMLAAGTLALLTAILGFIDGLTLGNTSMGEDFAKGAKKALIGEGVDKASAEGKGAPKNVQVGDLSSFGKQVTAAAFNAGQGGPADKDTQEREWREKTARLLDKIAANPANLFAVIEAAIISALDKSKGAVYDGAAQKGSKALIGATIGTAVLGPGGTALGAAIGASW